MQPVIVEEASTDMILSFAPHEPNFSAATPAVRFGISLSSCASAPPTASRSACTTGSTPDFGQSRGHSTWSRCHDHGGAGLQKPRRVDHDTRIQTATRSYLKNYKRVYEPCGLELERRNACPAGFGGECRPVPMTAFTRRFGSRPLGAALGTGRFFGLRGCGCGSCRPHT